MGVNLRSALERLALVPRAVAPADPMPGELWSNDATGRLLAWRAGQWRELAEKGDSPASRTLAAVGTARWIRVATVNGGSATGGGNISLLIGGQGLYSQATRVTDLVHFGQRGSDVYSWEAWRFGSNTAPWQYLVKQVSEFVFELWARRNAFDPLPQVTVVGAHNGTLQLDSEVDVLPAGLTALSTPVQSAAASHVHTAADVNAGVLDLARLPVAPSGNSNATQVVRADDARLSNARTPTAHTHAAADTTSGTFAIARLPVAASGASSTTQVVRADDVRLSRGNVISRAAGHAVRSQSVPNNDALYTVNMTGEYTIPAGARLAQVSQSQSGHCSTNAACTWLPRVRLRTVAGGANTDVSYGGDLVMHNEGNPALDLGYSVQGAFDVSAYVGGTLQLYTNVAHSSGSGAWLHPGWLSFTITFLT